jgi:hypothetical protein
MNTLQTIGLVLLAEAVLTLATAAVAEAVIHTGTSYAASGRAGPCGGIKWSVTLAAGSLLLRNRLWLSGSESDS